MRCSKNFFTSVLLFSLISVSLATDDPSCDLNDQAVLLQIKAKIKSPGTGIGSLDDWQPNTNCCDWDFIGCIAVGNKNAGRVNALTISGGSGLVGQIPNEIGNLPFLTNIMFFDEPKLTGPIPQSMSKLKNLQIITLNSNSLSGPIPAFLGQLKNLQQVDISDNKFSGVIPASLSKLTKLSAFNVSHNMLTGSIPNLQTKKLTSFDVSFNQLCGAIPAGLSKFGVSSFQNNKCLCGSPLAAC